MAIDHARAAAKILGGIEYRALTEDERTQQQAPLAGLALKAVRGVSRNSSGPIRRGDIIVSVDGQDAPMSEAELLAYFLQRKQPGDQVEAEVLRQGERISVELPVIF